MSEINNAAVFVGGQRKFKNVNVVDDGDVIRVLNRATGEEVTRYSVVEVAKAGMAWDIPASSQEGSARTRLVVQQGCGCSGMFPYDNDPNYSGAIQVTARR